MSPPPAVVSMSALLSLSVSYSRQLVVSPHSYNRHMLCVCHFRHYGHLLPQKTRVVDDDAVEYRRGQHGEQGERHHLR